MSNETAKKTFDCVAWTRKVRDEMYEETKHLSPDERLAWRASRRPTDPVLARMWDNAKPPPDTRWREHGTHRVDGRDETQVVIEIAHDEATGRYTASALADAIHAEGDSLDAIRANVKQAVDQYLDDTAPLSRPKYICLRFLRDEVIEA